MEMGIVRMIRPHSPLIQIGDGLTQPMVIIIVTVVISGIVVYVLMRILVPRIVQLMVLSSKNGVVPME